MIFYVNNVLMCLIRNINAADLEWLRCYLKQEDAVAVAA